MLQSITAGTRRSVRHESCFDERIMSLLSVVFVIVMVGVLLWALNSFIPMDGKIRNILNVVVVVFLVVWLLQGFGVLGPIGGIRIG